MNNSQSGNKPRYYNLMRYVNNHLFVKVILSDGSSPTLP